MREVKQASKLAPEDRREMRLPKCSVRLKTRLTLLAVSVEKRKV